MSSSLHLFSNTITGYGPPDGCLPSSKVSGGAVSISPSTSRGEHKVVSDIKFLSLKCATRAQLIACNASNGSYNRNPDFHKQNKRGFSRNRNWYNGDSKNLEESDIVSKKNGPVGPLNSGSRNPKFEETSAPGTMEREILELFRSVQAKIREKSRGKEEKKTVVPSEAKRKEEESVDSILKLLRKHTTEKMKKNINDNSSRDSVVNMQENGAVSENRKTRTFNSKNSAKHGPRESQRRHVSRPASNFSKRSPVPGVKIQPVYSDEDSKSKETVSNTVADLEPTFSVGDGLDEMPVEENSDMFASDIDEDEEQDKDEEQEVENPITANLSEMKLSELRAIAKSRGMKRYSKMKKQDLIELLS